MGSFVQNFNTQRQKHNTIKIVSQEKITMSSTYRQQFLDSARRRKSNIPLPNKNLKLDLSQMSDISNDNVDTENPNNNNNNNLQGGDNPKNKIKSRIPIASPPKPTAPSQISELESKLRLKKAETQTLSVELENAKKVLTTKINEIRESAKNVKDLKEENSLLTCLTEELKSKNSELLQKVENEKKLKKQIEQRNLRLEALLKTKPETTPKQKHQQPKKSYFKSVLFAVEHVLVLSCLSYAVYYKYVIEPEQQKKSLKKLWW